MLWCLAEWGWCVDVVIVVIKVVLVTVIVVICVCCDDCIHGELLGGFDYGPAALVVSMVVVDVVDVVGGLCQDVRRLD